VPSEIFEALGITVKKQEGQWTLFAQRWKLVVKEENFVEENGRLFLSPMLLPQLLPDFVLCVQEDFVRRSVNILCANKESLGSLIRYGKVRQLNIKDWQFQRVYRKLCQMNLLK
jgi:hypothetical protein